LERRETLVAFIRELLKEDYDPEAGDLLSHLDSVSLLQLVLFIEERFKIVLDMGEFDLENFRTVDTLLLALERSG
jgi:acyl carrier protein